MESRGVECMKRLALVLAIVMLCNDTMGDNPKRVQAQQLSEEEQEFGLIGSRQVHLSPLAAAAASQFVAGAGGATGELSGRFRRQVSIPEGSPWTGGSQTPGSPQAAQQPGGSGSGSGSGLFSFLGDLGPQMAQAKSISSLFNSAGSNSQQPGNGSGQSSASSLANGLSAAALMGQLSELVRSTQERQARALESSQQAAQQMSANAATAAQNAQGGIQAALADMGAGLQRIAANNPNLLPDIKNLYQQVSSKLSSASSSVAQATNPQAAGQAQFAQGIANQIAQPQPLPTPSS